MTWETQKYTAKFKKLLDAIAIHIQRDYKGGADIAKAIRDLVLPTFPLPFYPVLEGNPAVIDPAKQYMWQQKAQAMEKRENLLEDNKKRAYALVTGQCSPKLVSKIKGFDLYESTDQDQDIVQLIPIVRGYCCRFNDHQQGTWALMSTKHCASIFYQTYGMLTAD